MWEEVVGVKKTLDCDADLTSTHVCEGKRIKELVWSGKDLTMNWSG